MSTVYRLIDLDYQIYVISDNLLELPPHQTPELAMIVLDTLLPKMNARVISLSDAMDALSQA